MSRTAVIRGAKGSPGPDGTAAVAAHEADTTAVHGIADTSLLLDTGDIGTTVDAFGAASTAQAAAISTAASDATTKANAAAAASQPVNGNLTELAAISPVQGDIIYHNGTDWVRLPAGTATHVLTTGGAAANPAWAATSTVAALDDLTDVDTTGVATGEVLTWDGTQWVPDPLTIDLSTAGAVSPATTDYVVGTDTSNSGANAKFLVSDVLALLPGTSAASTTVSGTVELATSAETITGTDTDRAVTPAGLAAKVASATASGIVELATTAETQTGTDTVRAVTPAGSAATYATLATRVTFSNAAYTVVATRQAFIAQIGTMSASRVVTLPAASAFRAGDVLTIYDESGTVTAANTIVITRAGSDTISGATTVTIAAAYGWRRLVSDGTSKWSFDGGVLRSASNLSDLTDASAARTNLGLGTAATTAATAYATAAQGTTADAALPKLAGGAAVENIGSVESNVNTVAATGSTEALDTSVYGVHDCTMDQNCTFSFTNPAPSGKCSMITVIVRGAFTPTWPAATKWADATPPTYGTPSIYTFMTVDGGATWYGAQAGKAFA